MAERLLHAQSASSDSHTNVDTLVNKGAKSEDDDTERKIRLRKDGDRVRSLPLANSSARFSCREELEQTRHNEGNEEANSSCNFDNEIETLNERSKDDGREYDNQTRSDFDPLVRAIVGPLGRERSKDGVSEGDTVEGEGRDDIEYREEHDNVRDDFGPNRRGFRSFESKARIVLPVEGDNRRNSTSKVHDGGNSKRKVQREGGGQRGTKHGTNPVLLLDRLNETRYGVMEQLRENGSGEDGSKA